jgi:hypothetical protein
MNKSLTVLFMTIGSTIGAYAPVLFGVSSFSYISLAASLFGGLLGIWLAVKLFN